MRERRRSVATVRPGAEVRPLRPRVLAAGVEGEILHGGVPLQGGRGAASSADIAEGGSDGMTAETSADLIDRLTAAAAEAIANERPSLAYDVNRVRGIHVELEVRNNGAVIGGRCWVERATKPVRGGRG